MKGIDISEHNGYIDFGKVKKAGIDFVIIRIGWVGNKENHTKDKHFEAYYFGAKEQGLKIGFYVYSYVRNESSMNSAIKWIKEQINDKTHEYPIFIDVEDSQISDLDINIQTDLCKKFCQAFENSGVYASLDWFKNKLNVNELLNYKIWLAQWTTESSHSANFRVDLWQYSSNGTVDGIYSRVDLNKCLRCDNIEDITGEEKESMKIYQNGSTIEPVYSDTNLTNKIGSLNKYEKCDCYGIFNNRAVVRYKVDNSINYKIGFCKWLGGVK